MNRLIATLRRIVGRTDMLLQAILTIGVIMIPMGYYFAFEIGTPEGIIAGFGSILMGFILLVVSLFLTIQEENKNKKIEQKRFDDILQAIKDLKPKSDGGDNERRNSNNISDNL